MRRTVDNHRRLAGAAALAVGFAMTNLAYAGDDTEMKQLVDDAQKTLDLCQSVSSGCASQTQEAAGVLVFPEVLDASLIVGGTGAKGVLLSDDGEVKGYYQLGGGSVGLQAGVKESSQVYVFNDSKALAALVDSKTWKIGVDAEVTVIDAAADARATGGKGDVSVYVLDQKGLAAGASVEGLRISEIDDAGEDKTED